MTWLISNALMQNFANSLFLPEGAAESGEESYWGGLQFAPLNVISTPHSFWHNDKMMEPSNLSRFGLTSRLLTETLGEAVLTWYLAASRAKTSAQPEKAQASPENAAGFGNKWLALLAKYDPNTHSLKTAQCSLLEDSTPSSVTLPRWGSMRNGGLLVRTTPEQFTDATGFGYLPTITVNGNNNRKGVSKTSGNGLATVAKLLPTIRARDADRNGSAPKTHWKRSFGGNLLSDIAQLPPETICQRLDDGDNTREKLLPTLTATDTKGKSGAGYVQRHGAHRLSDYLPTLAASDATRGGKEITDNMTGQSLRQKAGGRLNETWCEKFMGWPTGSTALESLETDKYQEWLKLHG
jgi:hypothetical protein